MCGPRTLADAASAPLSLEAVRGKVDGDSVLAARKPLVIGGGRSLHIT